MEALKLNTIYHGNCLDVLKTFPDNSIDCCITSPPYWGLRDYGTATWVGGDENCGHKGKPFRTKENVNKHTGTGTDKKNTEDYQPYKETCLKCGATRQDEQIGLEKTPEEFVNKLADIFDEVKRVLKQTATLWLNIGDSYWGSGNASGHTSETKNLGATTSNYGATKGHSQQKHQYIKPKDLVGIPWMLAFELRKRGWYLRMDIIWNKPNPMPESVTDRPTKAHEYVFLLAKNAEVFYWVHRDTRKSADKQPKPDYRWIDNINNNELDTEPENWKTELLLNSKENRYERINLWQGKSYYFDSEAIKTESLEPEDDRGSRGGQKRKPTQLVNGIRNSGIYPKANKRSVWTVTTQPFPDAHFATFPEELIEPCILAGTSESGCCSNCGNPRERIVDKKLVPTYKASFNSVPDERDFIADAQDQGSNRQKDGHKPGWAYATTTLGWKPTCDCNSQIVPSIVLDPFSGSGTTAMVSRKKGRNYVGIELNSKYIKISDKRLYKELGMFV